MTPHSEADLRLGFTLRGHSVQPLPNYFGLLLVVSIDAVDCLGSLMSEITFYTSSGAYA